MSEPVEFENRDDSMLAGPLRLDEIVKRIELKIGGEHAGHLSAQGGTYCNNRSASGE